MDIVEENSENMRRNDDNSKDDKMNVKRRDMMRRFYILCNE